MATKSFQDICVEYAHQLGKGLPLTAPEMCNAVIMYLNQQITEMEGITTALQTAVTEAESSATEAINKADDVAETVNTLPKVPTPSTSDNGKVIGVQSGAYALVEQSGGGEAPADMVTTNTEQTITSYKTFVVNDHDTVAQFADARGNYIDMYANGVAVHDAAVTPAYTKYGCDKIETYGNFNALQYTLNIPNKNGTIALTSDIPDIPEPTTSDNGKVIGVQNGEYALLEQGGSAPSNMVTTNTIQTITAQKTLMVPESVVACILSIKKVNSDKSLCFTNYSVQWYNNGFYTNIVSDNPQSNVSLTLPLKNGKLAVISDIPDLDDYTGTVHIVQGTAGSGVAVHDTANTSPYTKYGYDKIETYGNSNVLQYRLNIPNKNGTIATLDDIGSSGSKKYLHNIIVTSDENIEIYFSIITGRGSSYTSLNDISNDIATMGVISATGWDRTSGAYSPIISIQHDNGEVKYSYISDSIMSAYLPPLVEATDNVIEL